jgi:beta-galactosidase
MRRILSVLAAGCACLHLAAQSPALEGFLYGNPTAPTGKEWESVEELSLNKEQPHAWFFSFESVEKARKVLPENSKYWQSLNGTWKFHWAPNPDERPADFHKEGFDASSWDNIPVPSSWNIVGIQKDGTQKYGTPIYVNQPVIFQHRVAVGDWKGGVMRTPHTHWTTYKHRNEVGSYLRTFSVPADWKGREVFITFDGVDSFFYLWINGKYVGFSKNSRNAAEFNITPYLKEEGENTVAVEVYRSSDASFLEAQDMFRLPGIFRTVAIQSRPSVRVRDLVVKPDLDENYENGVLNISAELLNTSKKNQKGLTMRYTLYSHELFNDDNKPTDVVAVSTPVTLPKYTGKSVLNTELKMIAPKKWTGEAPYRYTLVGELLDKKGKVLETVSTIVGFREVEIKDTKAEDDEFGLAGRYYYINGKPLKLKGVNRHESHPAVGHAITREMQKEEVMMMRRANINHVRNSHYPCDPYWYFLCDKYGIYLEDEANIESHEYYYGEASLSHPEEWKKAHVARVMEMAHATVNNACVVIWSLGNEAGPGNNFVAAYNALKAFDATRPVQYERNNDIVDMGSNQYPSIGWMRGAVTGKYNIKYPFHVSEYAHSMGNAVGNLIDYWEAIESTNFFCGGAIWDWVDQSMYNYDADGTRYLAYGGNFGDTPNDGQFVMNGIIFGDREPKPQYYEVKKVYQYVGVKMLDAKNGKVEIFNKNYYEPMNDYQIVWSLWKDGKCVQQNQPIQGPRMVLGPRQKMVYTMPYNYAKLAADGEYFAKVQFLLAEDMPWAKKGYVQAEEQLLVKSAAAAASIASVAGNGTITNTQAENIQTFKGEGFEVQFDMNKGTIHQLAYGNETVIPAGGGPRLNAFRAFVSNDNWCYQPWFQNGLHNLQHKAVDANTILNKDGSVVLTFTVVSQAPNAAQLQSKNGRYDSGIHTLIEHNDRPFGENDFKFTSNQIWTIYPDGSIELQSAITSSNPGVVLARLGYEMQVPAQLDQLAYYGRGPIDNYNDRKTGQFIEQFKSTVAKEFVNFPKPQQMGNHEETRWASISNKAGKGLVVVNEQPYAFSALNHSAMDMTMATHPHRLPKSDVNYVTIDAMVTGLGGNSCGQGGPLPHDRAFGAPTRMGFIIRPMGAKGGVDVATASEKPLLMQQQKNGQITIESGIEGATIMYKVNNEKKAKEYTAPINFRDGGTITAFYKDKPELKVSMTYAKIEKISTEVIFTSSEEVGEGNAKHLVDGDANSIWHTMYSVTVAKYPHWVDFDAGDTKNIKGFIYLPRQDGPNGNIKDYEILVSQDGKNWGEPILKGSFENNQKEKRVMLKAPVKARYFRFRALSSQNGADFASGAEFSIIAE